MLIYQPSVIHGKIEWLYLLFLGSFLSLYDFQSFFFAVFFWELPAIPPLTHRTMHLSHCHSSRSRSPDGKGFTSSEHNRNNTCNLDRTSSWSQQQQHLTFTKSDCGTQSTQVDAMFRNSHPKHWGWAHFSSAAPRHDVWLLSSEARLFKMRTG